MGTLHNRVQNHLPPHALMSLWLLHNREFPWHHVLFSCFVMLIFAMTCVTLLYGGFGRHGADLLRRNQTKPDITRCSQVESARWFHFLLIEVWCQCPHSPLILYDVHHVHSSTLKCLKCLKLWNVWNVHSSTLKFKASSNKSNKICYLLCLVFSNFKHMHS